MGDFGILIIRLMLAVVLMFHGAQKLFGAFDGPGLEGFAGYLETLKVPMPKVSAALCAGAEFFGGIVLVFGFLMRVLLLPVVFNMFVAAFVGHGNAFSIQNHGMEYALTLAVVLLGLVFTGPGFFSVDHCLFGRCKTKQEAPGVES